jgi:prophage regulatory protein
MTEDRIVRDAEATTISGLSRTRRHELAKLGKFPKKVKLSERASGYRHSDLMRWLETRPPASSAAS